MDTEPKKHWSRQWDIWALFIAAILFLTQILYFFTSISVTRIILITIGVVLISWAVLNSLSKNEMGNRQ